jgi:toxin YoeB
LITFTFAIAFGLCAIAMNGFIATCNCIVKIPAIVHSSLSVIYKCTYSERSEFCKDYLYWQKTDKKILSKINELLKDISRNPFSGIGKPEPLKHKYKGFWSRRIDGEHRLIYQLTDDEILIAKCRFHYD